MFTKVKYLFVSGVILWLLGFAALVKGLDGRSRAFVFLPLLLSGSFFIACVVKVLKLEKVSLVKQFMMVIAMIGVVVILFMFYAMAVFS
jgi:hypothetical protein